MCAINFLYSILKSSFRKRFASKRTWISTTQSTLLGICAMTSLVPSGAMDSSNVEDASSAGGNNASSVAIGPVQDETETYKTIHRNYLPPKSTKVTEQHACALLGASESKNSGKVAEMIKQCTTDRDRCKAFVSNKVDKLFIEFAQAKRMMTKDGGIITKMCEIGEDFAAHPTDVERQETLWQVQFGAFDMNEERKQRIVELTLKYMQWKYPKDESEPRHPKSNCCITQLVSARINEVNRSIKKRTDKLCGFHMIKSQPQTRSTDGKKQQAPRRKKGEYYPFFLVSGSNSPETSSDSVEKTTVAQQGGPSGNAAGTSSDGDLALKEQVKKLRLEKEKLQRQHKKDLESVQNEYSAKVIETQKASALALLTQAGEKAKKKNKKQQPNKAKVSQ